MANIFKRIANIFKSKKYGGYGKRKWSKGYSTNKSSKNYGGRGKKNKTKISIKSPLHF